MKMAHRLAIVLVAAAAGAACGDENLAKVTPQIEVSVEQLNFGNVPIHATKSKAVKLAAASQIEVRILKLEVVGPDAANFALPQDKPEAIDPDSAKDVDVAFTPDTERDFTATLILETDDPDEQDKHREIPLFGVGKSPNISVEPVAFTGGDEISAIRCPDDKNYPRCTTRKTLVIRNSGDVALEVKSLSFVGDHPQLTFLGSTSASGIAAQGFANVGLEFRPTSGTPDTYDTIIRIVSNDPDTETIDVPVHVKVVPNTAPTACARTYKVQRGQYVGGVWGYSDDIGPGKEGYGDPADPTVRAGYIVWMYDGGTDYGDTCKTDDPDGDDVYVRWTVLPLAGQPAPLVVGSAARKMWFEVPALGDYQVKIEAWDTLHVNAPTIDTVVVHAAPKDDITVALDWRETGQMTCTTNAGDCRFDLDLHLVRMENGVDPLDSRLWCYNDAYFFNREPDWGDLGSIGNPILNLDGQGLDERTRAENTTLEVAEPGEYWLVVNYFETNVNLDVPAEKVKVHLFTSSQNGPVRWPADTSSYYSPSRDLRYPTSTGLDLWVVGKVIWPGLAGGSVAVQPIDTYLSDLYPGDQSVQACSVRPPEN